MEGLVARRANHMIRGKELLVPPPDFWREESGWRLTQSPMAKELTNHAYVIKPPLKTQNDRVRRASGVVNRQRFGDRSALREHESPHPSPMPFPMQLFCPAVPEFIINW